MSAISSLANSLYLQSLQSTASGAFSTGGSAPGNTSASPVSASISQPGQLLSDLQQLQAQDPTKFKQVATQIASELQAAAQQQAPGGVGQFLTNLAAKFQNAASTGDLSQVQSHHGHHGHHAHGTYNSQGQTVSPASDGTAAANTSDPIQQLFANLIQQVQQAIGGVTSSPGTSSVT